MKYIFLIVIVPIPLSLSASTTDYYDRVILYGGAEKGILYSEGSTSKSPSYLKGGMGYGLDDNKLISLNISFDTDMRNIYLNPEFVLLLNEFSRLKFFLSAGLDFGIRDKFETGFRTSHGIIYDLFNHLSFSLGIDTRLNIYNGFYLISCGNLSLIIRI